MKILIHSFDYPVTTRMAGSPRLFTFLPATGAAASSDSGHVLPQPPARKQISPATRTTMACFKRWLRCRRRANSDYCESDMAEPASPSGWRLSLITRIACSGPSFSNAVANRLVDLMMRHGIELVYADGNFDAAIRPGAAARKPTIRNGAPFPLVADFCMTAGWRCRRPSRKSGCSSVPRLEARGIARGEKKAAERTDLAIIVRRRTRKGLSNRADGQGRSSYRTVSTVSTLPRCLPHAAVPAQGSWFSRA